MSFKKSFLGIIIFIVLVFHMLCYADSKRPVNILSRYNYLNSPEIISTIKKQCGVEVFYDEYYNTNECLDRIDKTEDFYYYDIIMFPSDVYKLIREKITVKNSNLNSAVKGYSKNIKEHYLSCGYPNNVVYFTLAISGFVWNPRVINLLVNDSISLMFEKAKNNIAIVLDDPVGVWNLMNNSKKKPPYDLLAEIFRRTIKNTDIYITNGYNELYNKSKFAFAFQRSGEAAYILKTAKNKSLTFFMHPDYSYVSPELMAELNTRPETRCVARVLASKKILDVVQKETYYLSPYGTNKSTADPIFQNIYKQLFDGTYKVRWLDSIFVKNSKEFSAIKNMWIAIHQLAQVMKNNFLVLKHDLDR